MILLYREWRRGEIRDAVEISRRIFLIHILPLAFIEWVIPSLNGLWLPQLKPTTRDITIGMAVLPGVLESCY
jgi:hypothetical protein